MDDPIKIIWKYKNKNRRIQYQTYIFIGPVSKEISKLIEKIKDQTLYNSWILLNKSELSVLERYYGIHWYKKFFNIYHISHILSTIKETNTQKRELLSKFGEEWFKIHIDQPEVIEKKILYSYEAMIKDEKNKKLAKKTRTMSIGDEDMADLDYRTSTKEELSKIFESRKQLKREEVKENSMSDSYSLTDSSEEDMYLPKTLTSKFLDTIHERNHKTQKGGFDDDVEEEDIEEDLDQDDKENEVGDEPGETFEGAKQEMENTGDEDKEEVDSENLEDVANTPEDEEELENIEDMYKADEANPDSNIEKTSNLIKQALNDDKIFDKQHKAILEFDNSKDTNIYDESLRDIYTKFYIYEYYIFKDDTIKTVKDKICCSMKNNNIFDGKNSFLIPSRQYLWSQYYYDGKVEKVMIGQKWLRRNELLNIDIEPNNNIRFYEELRGNLKVLKDNIKRYGGNKIRWEDDDNNILYDYEGYFTNNELFMIDIYNELGKGYKSDPDTIKNLSDVFIKIYFPKVRGDDIKYLLDYLNDEKKTESMKITNAYDLIITDLLMENEIMFMVEETKEKFNYKKIFKDNYITQSVIHVNLRTKNPKINPNTNKQNKLDLFRIFNEFEATDKYPFIQYQTLDGQIVFKFKETEINDYLKNKDNAEVLSKWFENSPVGISFKVKIVEKGQTKFMAINLKDSGQIEYKTQWKEEDMATIEDIRNTYVYVKELIEELNKDNNKIQFESPENAEFKYAFINTIQKFELPDNHAIDHNDLSEFSRYFYPYVALVIEPRKRQAKIQKTSSDKSKFGTYLRYKRVSKYENHARIEQRIMYFMRNYEFTDQSLSNEISKQFNITLERAIEEIERVKNKYPHLKKSRKVLKKFENIPKYKPPGIGIDIQGKQKEKYKIRVSGARDKEQLDRIINFMNILIFLYAETYIMKKPERQILKDKLKKLTNIARRRSKVDEVVNYAKEAKSVKIMTQLDKQRIGFKPEKGQNQWTRSCQNSGNDKKRRPQQYNTRNMSELLQKEFKLNKKTGNFERKTVMKDDRGKKVPITIKTIKLQEFDDEGNSTGNEIHYACGPEENGDHVYVGFLTRSNNPFGHCMPCCFKKDPSTSKNKEKRDFFNRCLGQLNKEIPMQTSNDTNETKNSKDIKDSSQTQQTNILSSSQIHNLAQKALGERLYILQDTNKIQEGRFGFLPKYLDFFFNYSLDKDKKIKQHYLVKSVNGYFFKYGTRQDSFQFLNAISALFITNVDEMKQKMIKVLEQDKSDMIFTSLNNGDIKTQFGTRENYIDFIKYNGYLDFNIVNNLLSVPGVLEKNGLNILIFQKKLITVKSTLEKEKVKEDFFLLCQNLEDVNALRNPERQTVFLLKENKNYYPIVLITKKDENAKGMDITRSFTYETKEKDKTNIVRHVSPFYEKNCQGSLMDDIIHKYSLPTAKMTKHIIDKIKDKSKDYDVKFQIIDVRNKCRYLITHNNTIIPTRSSGSLYNVQIVKTFEKYIDNFENTLKKLESLYEKTGHELEVKPIGVYYSDKMKSKLKIIGIITKTHNIVPIIETEIEIKDLESKGLNYENKPLFDKIDKEISKGRDNYIVDDRITNVNFAKYHDESYELFRLEFSEFINKDENNQLKKKLEQLISENKTKKEKINKIRLFMYKLIDRELYRMFKDHITGSISTEDPTIQEGGGDKFINIINRIPDLTNYQIKNDREECPVHKTKELCMTNKHCAWAHDNCYMGLTRQLVITFVNKISEELISNDFKAFEIMRVGNYFVSDIADYTKFKESHNQKIVRSTSNSIKKVLYELFGKDNIPIIGKKKISKISEVNSQQMNIENPLRDMKTFFVQNIIENNMSIFRAYVNSYYWIKNPFYDNETRNLGYYSAIQTDLSHYSRSIVIDWLQDPRNKDIIKKDLYQYMEQKKSSKHLVIDYINKLGTDVKTFGSCIVELFIMNKIQNIPIIVYDDDNTIIYVFNNGLMYHHKRDASNILTENKELAEIIKNKKNNINIRFSMISGNIIPDEIEVLYYK